MTTNKLPPLPEPAMRELNPYHGIDGDPHNGATHLQWFSADQMQAYAAEALRQSQSLPAGAVAGLVGKWRDRTNYADTGDEVDTLNYCADELEQALQADAREKGEAVDWRRLYRFQTAMRYMDNNNKLTVQRAQAMADADIKSIELGALATQPAHTVEFFTPGMIRDLATQPAQASEKDNG